MELTFSHLLKHSSLVVLKSSEATLDAYADQVANLVFGPDIQSFHPRRLLDFKLGRLCADLAHRQCVQRPLPELKVGARREPLWPVGIVGSISHGSSLVCAAVALSSEVRYLGVDLEEWGRVRPELGPSILADGELAGLTLLGDSLDESELLTLIFASKEALYKALYPWVQIFFGFDAAKVRELNYCQKRGDGHFVIELTKNLNESFGPAGIKSFTGKFQVSDKTLLTVIEER